MIFMGFRGPEALKDNLECESEFSTENGLANQRRKNLEWAEFYARGRGHG